MKQYPFRPVEYSVPDYHEPRSREQNFPNRPLVEQIQELRGTIELVRCRNGVIFSCIDPSIFAILDQLATIVDQIDYHQQCHHQQCVGDHAE